MRVHSRRIQLRKTFFISVKFLKVKQLSYLYICNLLSLLRSLLKGGRPSRAARPKKTLFNSNFPVSRAMVGKQKSPHCSPRPIRNTLVYITHVCAMISRIRIDITKRGTFKMLVCSGSRLPMVSNITKAHADSVSVSQYSGRP